MRLWIIQWLRRIANHEDIGNIITVNLIPKGKEMIFSYRCGNSMLSIQLRRHYKQFQKQNKWGINWFRVRIF